MKATAVIPAAGLGKRFGAQKQFQLLAGRPVLAHTLQAFEQSPSVTTVCVVVPEDEILAVREIIKTYSLKKALHVVAGGRERQDSVRLGFEAVEPCDIIVVHDGVRPLVTVEVIEKTIQGALEFSGCVAALPVKETTKRVSAEGFIQETVNRSDLWSMQTPQAFQYEIFRKAILQSVQDDFLGTDEAMLVERTGRKIKVVVGDPINIKITTPEDIGVAESLLKLRSS